MSDEPRETLQEFERRLHEWAERDSAIDATELEKILRARLPERRSARRVRLALAAAAVSAALVVVGLEVARNPHSEPALQGTQEVFDVPANAILVLREDGPPIYVLTEPEPTEGVTP
jgi:hypothetical protein